MLRSCKRGLSALKYVIPAAHSIQIKSRVKGKVLEHVHGRQAYWHPPGQTAMQIRSLNMNQIIGARAVALNPPDAVTL